ncbi:MAG: hypothetical protein WCK34_14750 [Bacteroidota bacterium]
MENLTIQNTYGLTAKDTTIFCQADTLTKLVDQAIKNLLDNTVHKGTVVRWSAAFALAAIIRLKLPVNHDLVPAAEAIAEGEEKNSIRKIYLDAIRKSAK